jgi:hypothetical protein
MVDTFGKLHLQTISLKIEKKKLIKLIAGISKRSTEQ